MHRVLRLTAILPWIAALAAPVHLLAATLRADIYVTGLSVPVAFVQDPSNTSTQYVVQQDGRIRIISGGVLQNFDFLNLSSVVSFGGEQGLLGLAFPPDYASSGRLYVNYTNLNGDTVIARYKRSTSNPQVADPSSAFPFQFPGGQRFIPQPYSNHNGGNLMFGPDGFLYIGMGDGGSGNDPENRAQDPSSLLGKMLRLDVSVPDNNTVGYAVPPGNPFVGGVPVLAPLVWAFGLRNPWKFTFDSPAFGGTGALVIGDVGQNAWEEVDYEPAAHGGRNYGWRRREGAHDNITSLPAAYTPLRDPIFEYSHDSNAPISGNSITGGYVYRGSALGLTYAGRYFFADFVAGRLWSLGLTLNGTTGEATQNGFIEHTAELGGTGNLGNISAFGVDASGELYVVSYSRGIVFRVATTCAAALNPASATFDASGGNSSIAVSVAAGCSWTATSNNGFVTITGGSSGTGNGTVGYSVAANVGAANVSNPARNGSMTIADRTFAVSQNGCTFAIAPTAESFGAAGGGGSVDVVAPAACSWTVAGQPPWASTVTGAAGAGNGRWTFSIAANAGGPRAQTMAVAGNSFALTQLNVPVNTIVAGRRSAFDLADGSSEHWSSMEMAGGRSYCALLSPAPTSQLRAAPALVALRADASTTIAAGSTSVCFVAPAAETALFKVTQADAAPRSHLFTIVETTLWTDWFFVGGDYLSYTIVRNTTDSTVNTTLTWRSADTGASVGTVSIAIPAHGVAYYEARTVTGGATTMGSVEVAHNGEPQALVGSQTTLSPTTGLSFDVLGVQRRQQ